MRLRPPRAWAARPASKAERMPGVASTSGASAMTGGAARAVAGTAVRREPSPAGRIAAVLLAVALAGMHRASSRQRYAVRCLALLVMAVCPLITLLVSQPTPPNTGQAAAPVHKCGSDPDGASLNERARTHSFIQLKGTDGRGRADMPAGNAIVLTAAGSQTEVECRGPQAFHTCLKYSRLDDMGRADPHTLAAFNRSV